MNNLPTADEFYIQLGFMPNHHQLGYDIETAMIEFAKLHVQEALKAAGEKAIVTVVDYEFELEPPTPIWGVDSNSILNAYPLDKIK